MSSPQKPARKNYKKISDDQLDDLAGGRYAVDPVTGYEIPGEDQMLQQRLRKNQRL